MPRTIGAQICATQFLGDMIPGSIMITDWMACVWEPTYLTQIAYLTHRVDKMFLFICHLGRDSSEVDTFDPSGLEAGLSSTDGFVDGGYPLFYCPN